MLDAERMMELEAEQRRQREELSQATNNITRLTTLHESNEGRFKEVMEVLKDVTARMVATAGMDVSIKNITEVLNEVKGDLRTYKHDMNNVNVTLQSINLMQEKITTNEKIGVRHETRLDAQDDKLSDLKTWQSNMDGAGVINYRIKIEELEKWKKQVEGGQQAYKNSAAIGWKAFAITGTIAAGLGSFGAFLVNLFYHPNG